MTRLACLLLTLIPLPLALADPEPAKRFDFELLASIRDVGEATVSPDGTHLAYVLRVPRRIGEEENGPAWKELWVAGFDGAPRPYVGGAVTVSKVRFTPDGRRITYLAKRRDDEETALWAIPVDGGESVRWVALETAIRDYRVAPDGRRVAILADEPQEPEREARIEAGYDEEVFEEALPRRRVWLVDPEGDPDAANGSPAEPRGLTVDGSVFDLEWLPDGSGLVLAVAPEPTIDAEYMLQRIRVHAVDDGALLGRLDNPGKLGSFAVSPDGRRIALISAGDPNDPKEGRLLVGPTAGGELRDLLPGLDGHVTSIAWRDGDTVAYLADIGEETRFAEVDLEGSTVRVLAESGPAPRPGGRAPVMTSLALSADGRRAALIGERPDHPAELYAWEAGTGAPRRLSHSNPALDGLELAPQRVSRWTARDGLSLSGILIEPLTRPEAGSSAPLLMIVHGGPESHVRNGWVTSYSRPGQLAAARGYAVFYPNYRGSTGRGVAFSKLGQGDAAGAEFDDLVDAVDALVEAGVADRDRVGITGGSYGGYATAWCATRHTERFRAGVMFVGISNKLSKGLTTEIPVEDRMVHTGFDPWTRWPFSLERSPIYYAEQSRTALLIAHGEKDSRVHPSQSLQLYRALKLIGKTPVRYVRYPDEGHGNTRAAARDDYARRLMRWMDHFLLGDGQGLPPLEPERPLPNG